MTKLRKSAKGRECQIRSPYCNFNNETTVLCHLGGAGMGLKNDDMFGAFGCSSCHDAVDHRTPSPYMNEMINNWFYDGMVRTQKIWLEEGLISHE